MNRLLDRSDTASAFHIGDRQSYRFGRLDRHEANLSTVNAACLNFPPGGKSITPEPDAFGCISSTFTGAECPKSGDKPISAAGGEMSND